MGPSTHNPLIMEHCHVATAIAQDSSASYLLACVALLVPLFASIFANNHHTLLKGPNIARGGMNSLFKVSTKH